MTRELAAGLRGERSGLLDLYWLAAHGHPVPEEAIPAVLWTRHRIGDPYSPWQALNAALRRP